MVAPSLLSQLRDVVLSRVTVAARPGFVLEPTTPPIDGRRRWIWYAPTLGGVLPDENNAWMCGRLLQQGFAIGGVDVGESYGSPRGQAVFSQFYDHLVGELSLDPTPSLLAQSRGGLMLFPWAAANVAKVRRIGAIFPACDLRSYPGLDAACAAYGCSSDELAERLPAHNPIELLAPLAAADVPVFLVHGDSDELVPLEDNSGALRERYAALGGRAELAVVAGWGHEVVPELFENAELLDFLCGTREVG